MSLFCLDIKLPELWSHRMELRTEGWEPSSQSRKYLNSLICIWYPPSNMAEVSFLPLQRWKLWSFHLVEEEQLALCKGRGTWESEFLKNALLFSPIYSRSSLPLTFPEVRGSTSSWAFWEGTARFFFPHSTWRFCFLLSAKPFVYFHLSFSCENFAGGVSSPVLSVSWI
jgi:hypothetical protein